MNLKGILVSIVLAFGFLNNAVGEVSAERKFYNAVDIYRMADEKSRKLGGRDIDVASFRLAIENLDAAIPNLRGLFLGRALVLKASCYYWLHLDKMSKGPKVYDPERPPDPLMQQGLSFALQGRRILKESGGFEDLPWANDIVQKLGGE